MNLLQVRQDMPNPVLELGGYTPVTGYWRDIISLTNTLLEVALRESHTPKQVQSGANAIIKGYMFKGNHTGVEWAEFTMAINHMLWALYSQDDKDGYIHNVLRALDSLYYQWRDKALDTLKGDELSTYLRITD